MKSRRIVVVVAVLIAGIGAGTYLFLRDHPEAAAIDARYREFHKAMEARDFTAAYAFASPDYRAKNNLQKFEKDFQDAGDPFIRLHPGRSVRVDGDRAWLYPRESKLLELWAGPDYEWIEIEGTWFLTGQVKWYFD